MSDPDRLFKFSVDAAGKFTYTPPGDWAYAHGHLVRFESTAGPFTVNFVPKTEPPSKTFNPLHGPLDSKENPAGVHSAETKVSDEFSKSARKAIQLSNSSDAEKNGFIAKYFYAISVKDATGRIVFKDDTHNGTYTC